MRAWALALALVAAVAGCRSEPALLRRGHEKDLIEAIQQTLLTSVEAEKSAVLATSDEESVQMARESRDLEVKIDRLRGELRALILQDGRPVEVERLDAFDASWKELTTVDERLLALAVANTNLKAARLLAQEGFATVDRFAVALAEMQSASTDPETIRALGGASVAAWREQALLSIHIPAADETEMTRLEQQMAVLGADVDRTLANARAAGAGPGDALVIASSAWTDYRRISAEVVRLSRENSNVRSFDVSVHEKRKVTKECLGALAALGEAVESGPRPAR